MKNAALRILPILIPLILCGCVERDQADAMLLKGCVAGINTLLDPTQPIDKIVKKEFSPSPEGNDMRHVSISATLKNDWSETPNQYDCVFEEQFGFLGMSYTASVYQIRTADKTIGKSGQDILGDAQDFLKLNDAVRGAMYAGTDQGTLSDAVADKPDDNSQKDTAQ